MSWLSSLNPTPAFPAYTGPYAVGSVDVELPADQLDTPSPAPVGDDIGTVAFRIFYPCEKSTTYRPVRWLPNPQKRYVAAYSQFLGASSAIAEAISLLPQLLSYVTIPVHRNAPLLHNTSNTRWPVMIFSHGLGGSRNAYSHLCGSLASHGMVVIATDHRDGSAPTAHIRATEKTKARTIPYIRMSHNPSPELWRARDEQLRTRLWEMGLVHDAIVKIDTGSAPKNMDPNSVSWRRNDVNEVLSMFKDTLAVHNPGSIAFAGHSFGGATVYQFLKSVFYRPDPEKEGFSPLYTPLESSSLVRQITPHTPATLLDPWCLPMQSPSTAWLWSKPLPCFTPGGPGGANLLAILSEGFFKWSEHLAVTMQAVSENPAAPPKNPAQAPPHLFYPVGSAHLSQSDFSILFPWLTKKMFKAEDPERMLKLNVRAILQVLRQSGFDVAPTSVIDREEEEHNNDAQVVVNDDQRGDWKILDTKGGVKGWVALRTTDDSEEVLKEVSSDSDGVGKGALLSEVIKDHGGSQQQAHQPQEVEARG
ncbi:hypothetical protein EJ05DRAFT_500075 [Pseudovirgaria hyperparasitica]|uniref:Putative phospholipase n=1 Tax=Pseudovirgaria hyperparasitica TaxID=470096 RepID=A0A6A6W9K6_9PEZI|nr:uncharacterized protein EJ05DRAFT_500075 [Pseudovirgaria hyperparasitica]KAF2758556.1 hypothetical protein EJ05DRAFT_500075 [Pseudovirgaria hyperparasitica]